jgi:hypothetical protein
MMCVSSAPAACWAHGLLAASRPAVCMPALNIPARAARKPPPTNPHHPCRNPPASSPLHPFPAHQHSEEDYFEDSDEEVLVPLEAIQAELMRPHQAAGGPAGAQQQHAQLQQLPAPRAQELRQLTQADSEGGSSEGGSSSTGSISDASPLCSRHLVGRHRRLTSDVHAVLTAGMDLFEPIGECSRARACTPACLPRGSVDAGTAVQLPPALTQAEPGWRTLRRRGLHRRGAAADAGFAPAGGAAPGAAGCIRRMLRQRACQRAGAARRAHTPRPGPHAPRDHRAAQGGAEPAARHGPVLQVGSPLAGGGGPGGGVGASAPPPGQGCWAAAGLLPGQHRILRLQLLLCPTGRQPRQFDCAARALQLDMAGPTGAASCQLTRRCHCPLPPTTTIILRRSATL